MRIAALADLHFRESLRGTLKDLFSDINSKADVFLLCGDLTDQGTPAEAEALVEGLRAFTIPVLGILGNHDYETGRQDEVRKALAGHVRFLENEPVELDGVGFAGAKGFCGGFDNHMLQPWGESMVKQFVLEAVQEAMLLEGGLAKLRTERKIALLHYAPVRHTVEGEPVEIWPYLGSSRLVEPIDRFGVDIVFHGHAHGGMPEGVTPKGTQVYNVALPLLRRLNPNQPYVLREI